MNAFRLAGDLSHLLAIIILLTKLWTSRSCAGISGKTQLLFALTYTARYLDLVTSYISAYNSVMKVFFIISSYATIYSIYVTFRASYDHKHDTLRIEFLILPAAILSLVINHYFSPVEVLWTFSIYLESVAIIPQLFMVFKTGIVETITSYYLFALGSYRAFYIFNWIYRFTSEGFYDLIAIVAGIVQTALFCNFFYLCHLRSMSPEPNEELSKDIKSSEPHSPDFKTILYILPPTHLPIKSKVAHTIFKAPLNQDQVHLLSLDLDQGLHHPQKFLSAKHIQEA